MPERVPGDPRPDIPIPLALALWLRTRLVRLASNYHLATTLNQYYFFLMIPIALYASGGTMHGVPLNPLASILTSNCHDNPQNKTSPQTALSMNASLNIDMRLPLQFNNYNVQGDEQCHRSTAVRRTARRAR